MPEEPEWWGDEDETPEGPGYENYGLKSECFIVTDNPVVAVILGPDGEVLLETRERDDRFGFLKWAEDR